MFDPHAAWLRVPHTPNKQTENAALQMQHQNNLGRFLCTGTLSRPLVQVHARKSWVPVTVGQQPLRNIGQSTRQGEIMKLCAVQRRGATRFETVAEAAHVAELAASRVRTTKCHRDARARLSQTVSSTVPTPVN